MQRISFIGILIFAMMQSTLLFAKESLDWEQALVINGSGTKTNETFDLQNHTLITPDDLQHSYVLGFDPERHLQKKFRKGLVKPLHNGSWTIYGKQYASHKVRDIIIKPWKKKELKQFTKRVLTDPELWSYQDNQKGLYFERDKKAILVVKKPNGAYSYLNATQAKLFFENIQQKKYKYAKDGMPLFVYAPKIGKIKILSSTRLSEVLANVQKIDGDKLFLLMACNASRSINKTLTLKTKEKDIDLSQNNKLVHGKIL